MEWERGEMEGWWGREGRRGGLDLGGGRERERVGGRDEGKGRGEEWKGKGDGWRERRREEKGRGEEEWKGKGRGGRESKVIGRGGWNGCRRREEERDWNGEKVFFFYVVGNWNEGRGREREGDWDRWRIGQWGMG